MASLSQRLGHNLVRETIATLFQAINSKTSSTLFPTLASSRMKTDTVAPMPQDPKVKSYIAAYFKYVHPAYPFLDRSLFEDKLQTQNFSEYVRDNPVFSALYHSILAIGCCHIDGGSFIPGEGKAWKLYHVALDLLPLVLLPHESLCNLQAIVAMAIFAQTPSCIQIGDMLISESARMAHMLRYNRLSIQTRHEAVCARTFWVVLIMDNMNSFACGRASMIPSYDIATPLPQTEEAIIGGFNWFTTMIRFAQLAARSYEMLFSVNAESNTKGFTRSNVAHLRGELETWRMSIPEEFRPGTFFRALDYSTSISRSLAVMLHCHYHSMFIALSRKDIHITNEGDQQDRTRKALQLTLSARTVIELSKYIETKPYTAVWIMAVMPLSASFIVFDFVVHNPLHSETEANLMALGIAAGHFHQLGYSSEGSFLVSSVSDLAHIAREYVRAESTKGGTHPNPSQYSLDERGLSILSTNQNWSIVEDQPYSLPTIQSNKQRQEQQSSLVDYSSSNPALDFLEIPVDEGYLPFLSASSFWPNSASLIDPFFAELGTGMTREETKQ